MTLHALLFLADEGPNFVKLDTGNTDADHTAVVQLGTALAD